MTATELLRSDHKQINDLFDQSEASDDSREKRRLFHDIQQLLDLHLFVEETVFYPHLSEKKEFGDTIQSFYDDHQKVKDLLKQASKAMEKSEFESLVDQIASSFQQHVEEEENTLFPKVESLIPSEELKEITDHLTKAKEAYPGGKLGPGRPEAA